MRSICHVPQFEPLEDDEEIHISEEQSQEEHLRHEFEPYFEGAFEVECVEEFEEDAHYHVQDGNDD